MKNRIHIFTGHFGSGKTEVALNFALQEKKKGEDVVIVDLDIVNPYFRTNDARNVLMKNGIKVVANNYASSNVDMPTMPLDILSVFSNDNSVVVFDVGGDDDGALALGQYKQYFDKYGYEMHFIVNTNLFFFFFSYFFFFIFLFLFFFVFFFFFFFFYFFFFFFFF